VAFIAVKVWYLMTPFCKYWFARSVLGVSWFVGIRYFDKESERLIDEKDEKEWKKITDQLTLGKDVGGISTFLIEK
jgi:hypothetical protein